MMPRKFCWELSVPLLILSCLLEIVSSKTVPNPVESLCYPKLHSGNHAYLIGYGSLVSTKSKNRTDPLTGTNIPVNVRGYVRKWNCRGTPVGQSTTYLGVDQDKDPEKTGSFNGVVFKLHNQKSLDEFDTREAYYCRQEVNVSDIQFLVDKSVSPEVEADFPQEGAQFYIYLVKPQFFAWPSNKYPIVQTYVDIFLTGCMEMEETYSIKNYADDCFSTTVGWNHSWVNDRLIPRRPFVNQPKAFAIDNLIEKNLPGHFDRVRIENEIGYYYYAENYSRNVAGDLFLTLVTFGLTVLRSF